MRFVAGTSGTSVVWDLRQKRPVISFTDSASKTSRSALAWNPEIATQVPFLITVSISACMHVYSSVCMHVYSTVDVMDWSEALARRWRLSTCGCWRVHHSKQAVARNEAASSTIIPMPALFARLNV
jgi:hypothetical protein